jgi:hypothetical protein
MFDAVTNMIPIRRNALIVICEFLTIPLTALQNRMTGKLLSDRNQLEKLSVSSSSLRTSKPAKVEGGLPAIRTDGRLFIMLDNLFANSNHFEFSSSSNAKPQVRPVRKSWFRSGNRQTISNPIVWASKGVRQPLARVGDELGTIGSELAHSLNLGRCKAFWEEVASRGYSVLGQLRVCQGGRTMTWMRVSSMLGIILLGSLPLCCQESQTALSFWGNLSPERLNSTGDYPFGLPRSRQVLFSSERMR